MFIKKRIEMKSQITIFTILFLSFYSLDLLSQEEILSSSQELTSEQAEIAKKFLEENNSFINQSDDFNVSKDETIVEKKLQASVESQNKKFGYDFISSSPTSITATGDLPLPNDYEISLGDQLSIILSGSKKGILKLAIFFLKLFFKYIQIKPAKNSKHLELIE